VTEFRRATLEELRIMLAWAAEEGWNPGLDDAAAFHAADPQGFFVAIHKGVPVASISVVTHGEQFAFLGLYIVRPAFRGRGIGLGLWRYALAETATQTIGLDGVEDQQENYKASGFAHAGATTRFTGEIPARRHAGVREAVGTDCAALVALEAEASGVTKPAYLNAWFTPTATRRTLILEENGQGRGICTVRQCREGAKIGPLVAADGDAARALIEHAATHFAGSVTLDVPQSAQMLSEICRSYAMSAGFRTARMYRGPFTPTPHPLYAVASLELG